MPTMEPARPRRSRGGRPDEVHGRAATPVTHSATTAANLLGLQATAGNRAVGAMLDVQRALTSPRFTGDPVLTNVDAGTETLKHGDTGAPVRKVQHAIHDAGIRFRTYGVDGIYKSETRHRVGTYQATEGVSGDSQGEVGQHTIRSLDARYPATALPSTAGDPYTFVEMKAVLAQWNTPLLHDLANLRVETVARLHWADERFDGSGWVPDPMNGAGETAGTSIIIATNDTNEAVARTLYHEYQHARAPYAYRNRGSEAEEVRAYELETYWAIARGLTPDPGLTTTDPVTGDVEIDPAGVSATVGGYPGVAGPAPGEVVAKVGATDVRVRLPSGQVTTRAAIAGDTVPGPRVLTAPRRVVPSADWL